mmetsp:Transcript_84327/g.243374  ORF Transcript_84327/g.243374 Transcript_84327/m.243374 type:complete len:321 (+) Transcript_84327:325-1287(+)
MGSCVSNSTLPGGTPAGTVRSSSLPSGALHGNRSPGFASGGIRTDTTLGDFSCVRDAGLARPLPLSDDAGGGSAEQFQDFVRGSCVSFSSQPGGTPSGTAMSNSRPSGVVHDNMVPGTASGGTTTDAVIGGGSTDTAAAGDDDPFGSSASQAHALVVGSCDSHRVLPGGTPGGTAMSSWRPSGKVNGNIVPAAASGGTTREYRCSGDAAGDFAGSTEQLHFSVIGSLVRINTSPGPTPGGTEMSISRPSGVLCCKTEPGFAQAGISTEKLICASSVAPPAACAVQLQPPLAGSCVRVKVSPGYTPSGTTRSSSRPSGVVC